MEERQHMHTAKQPGQRSGQKLAQPVQRAADGFAASAASTSAATVVLFPDPVGPPTSTSPRAAGTISTGMRPREPSRGTSFPLETMMTWRRDAASSSTPTICRAAPAS